MFFVIHLLLPRFSLNLYVSLFNYWLSKCFFSLLYFSVYVSLRKSRIKFFLDQYLFVVAVIEVLQSQTCLIAVDVMGKKRFIWDLLRIVRGFHAETQPVVELFHLTFFVPVIFRHYTVCITNLQNSADLFLAMFELPRLYRLYWACILSLES